MSSARLPERGGSTPLAAGLPPAPGSLPTGLFRAPTPASRTAHLVPCARCGALNGRSALTCWSCEADLLALSPFAQTALTLASVERAVEPEPAAPALRATTAEGRQGLHLIARESVAVSVQVAPAAAAPEHTLHLPVLTAQVDDTPPEPRRRKSRHLDRSMVGLALAAVALLAAAAGLRWLVPPPPVLAAAPLADVRSPPLKPRADAALERPFSAALQGGEPDRANLSFPPVEVAPDAPALDRPTGADAPSRPAPPTRVVSTPPRPLPKPREIRETVSPPPAACTSNMAALGFCTLAPAPAKE